MKRRELEHVLRASAAITGADRFVVIGSQAILGRFPDAPEELLASREADIYSGTSCADTDLIEGSIGEGSPFHQTFGYYAHGVGPETAVLPSGWQERVVEVRTPSTGGATGLCLEEHDLAASKLAAGRDKDIAFVAALLRHGLASAVVIRERIGQMGLPPELRQACHARLDRAVARCADGGRA